MGLSVKSVAVVVADRRRAARWYREKLGFKLADDDGEHWLTVADPKRRFRLHLCEKGGRAGRRPPRGEVGNTGILLVTEEPFLRACARLKRRGVRFSFGPRELPWGWLAKFRDPDGNEFWFVPDW